MSAKYNDHYSLGRSKRAPFIAGEDAQTRHERRKLIAREDKAFIEPWCREHGFTMQMNNDGHHWILFNPIKQLRIEWWPSSAKLVFNQQWTAGVHCHDVTQLIEECTRRLEKEVKKCGNG